MFGLSPSLSTFSSSLLLPPFTSFYVFTSSQLFFALFIPIRPYCLLILLTLFFLLFPYYLLSLLFSSSCFSVLFLSLSLSSPSSLFSIRIFSSFAEGLPSRKSALVGGSGDETEVRWSKRERDNIQRVG